jgi:hypothetical protein
MENFRECRRNDMWWYYHGRRTTPVCSNSCYSKSAYYSVGNTEYQRRYNRCCLSPTTLNPCSYLVRHGESILKIFKYHIQLSLVVYSFALQHCDNKNTIIWLLLGILSIWTRRKAGLVNLYMVSAPSEKFGLHAKCMNLNTQKEEWMSIRITICITLPLHFTVRQIKWKYTAKKTNRYKKCNSSLKFPL